MTLSTLQMANRVKSRLNSFNPRLAVVAFERAACLKKNANRISNSSPPYWMSEQIESDLAIFNQQDLQKRALDQFFETYDRVKNPWDLVRYKVKDNRLYQEAFGHYSRCVIPRLPILASALNRLCRHFRVPDVDFVISQADALDKEEHEIPIFVFAKNSSLSPKNILIPDFEALGLFHLDHYGEIRWEDGVEKAVFRGAMTGGYFNVDNFEKFPRSVAVRVSLDNPELIDARYTTLSQTSQPKEIATRYKEYFGKSLSVGQQLKYKYQLLIDGNTCAYSRALWQLFSGCVILKQNSENIQWYYRGIKPNIHYLPVSSELSDLR